MRTIRLAHAINKTDHPTLFQKTVHIYLKLQEMAEAEILNYVAPDELKKIKANDPNPEFRAYVVAHEGVSEGKLVGGGNIIKQWFKGAIEKVFSKMTNGLKVFHRHNADNSHEGREPIGHVVGRALQTFKDRLTAIAVMYIKPAFRHLPLDVCSMEADISIDPHSEQVNPVDVKEMTGIALGNSKVDKPGFAGAELLSAIQAFHSRSPERGYFMNGETKITIDELRQFVKTEKISPSDIFTVEQLTDDASVKGFVKSEIKTAVAGEYSHRKRTDEEFQNQSEDWKNKEKELNDKIADLTKVASESKVKALLETAKSKRELSDQQSKFIEKRLDSFQPKDLDTIEKDFDDHLDSELDKFKDTAEIFGIKSEEKKKDKDEDGGGGNGDEGDDEGGGDEGANPYLPTIDE